MAEKPRHKPQAKRTLEEVLRSLKDLVRNDLTVPRAPSGPVAEPRPVAPDEPESFSEALTRLDAIIDEKLLGPGRTAPPAAPPSPVEDIEIEWDEAAEPREGDDGATARPDARTREPDLRDPEAEAGAATSDGDIPDAGDPGQADDAGALPPADAADLAALEAIELGPIAPQTPAQDVPSLEPRERAAALQEAFNFLAPEAPHGGDRAPAPGESPPPSDAVPGPDAQTLVAGPPGLDWHETSTGAVDTRETANDRDLHWIESAPKPGDSDDARREPVLDHPRPPPMSADTREPDRGAPGAGTDDARPGSGDAPMSRPTESARAQHASPTGNAEPPTLEEEIPVLQDLAPGPPAGGAALPDVAHARDIAIRVIARINIERRKAGETPLDIKTIERLQRYLAEALAKAAAGRAK